MAYDVWRAYWHRIPDIRVRFRSRVRPEGAHADLRVQVRPDLPIDKAHVIGHLVAERLEEELGLDDVVVHVEPPAGHRTDWRP